MKRLSLVLFFAVSLALVAGCGTSDTDTAAATDELASTEQGLVTCGPAPLVIPQKPGGGCKTGYALNPTTGCCTDRR